MSLIVWKIKCSWSESKLLIHIKNGCLNCTSSTIFALNLVIKTLWHISDVLLCICSYISPSLSLTIEQAMLWFGRSPDILLLLLCGFVLQISSLSSPFLLIDSWAQVWKQTQRSSGGGWKAICSWLPFTPWTRYRCPSTLCRFQHCA